MIKGNFLQSSYHPMNLSSTLINIKSALITLRALPTYQFENWEAMNQIWLTCQIMLRRCRIYWNRFPVVVNSFQNIQLLQYLLSDIVLSSLFVFKLNIKRRPTSNKQKIIDVSMLYAIKLPYKSEKLFNLRLQFFILSPLKTFIKTPTKRWCQSSRRSKPLRIPA